MVLPVYALLRASILDFRARLANQCKYFPVYTLFRASILDFRARLENRCSVIAATAKNGSPAAQSWGAGGDRRGKLVLKMTTGAASEVILAATATAGGTILLCSEGN